QVLRQRRDSGSGLQNDVWGCQTCRSGEIGPLPSPQNWRSGTARRTAWHRNRPVADLTPRAPGGLAPHSDRFADLTPNPLGGLAPSSGRFGDLTPKTG